MNGWDQDRARTSSSGGANSAAAQLREYNPFLFGLSPKLRRQSGGENMEKKGIVLPELSCRTATELPPPDFSAPGGHPPEQPESFGGSPAAPARGARRQFGISAPGVQSLSPPCRGSWTSESQGQSSFPPILLNHGRDIPHYES
ncbi:unnamed protein product [Boreogadus saida]